MNSVGTNSKTRNIFIGSASVIENKPKNKQNMTREMGLFKGPLYRYRKVLHRTTKAYSRGCR